MSKILMAFAGSFVLFTSPLSAQMAGSSTCQEQIKNLGPTFKGIDPTICEKMLHLDPCKSVDGQPIYHYEKVSTDSRAKKIFVMALIHGDEPPSLDVALSWMQRLERIESRNSWRVIPIANPDGLKAKTRTNKSGVDLNRNFPTDDWEKTAIMQWKTQKKSDPRRYPGPTAASEPETQCYIKHFEDFKPDFIISIHTPLGVLDFDGPKLDFPPFSPLPWLSLGHYPGSLGRFMWRDKKVPVLTVELKGNNGLKRLEEFDKLQDITGTVAIQANRVLKKQARN